MSFLALAITFLVAALVCGVLWFLSTFLGPSEPSLIKQQPFECGWEPLDTPRARFSVKFYVVAMLFILFDVEVALLYPWAVQFRSLGFAGFIEMFIFVLVLGIGLLYAWLRGALEWD